ncbi:TraR/DksA C4-type zinc finger protein [Streptomyces sp. NPDC048057]|uniref:TraR/DksA family transcriptional regulator n=1 Tax=Streptomyces sp. NPDC048057 TaxID=3155628 RepID=UPI00340EF3D5
MVAKKTAAKKSAAQEAVAGTAAGGPRKDAADGAATEGSAGKEPVARKAAAKATKKAPAKKTAAKKAAKETAGATAPTAEKAPAKKTAAKKAVAKKVAAKKSAAQKSAKTAKTAKKSPRQTGAGKVGAKKTVALDEGPTAVPTARDAAAPAQELAVRPGEEPWTPEEVAAARAKLEGDVARLTAELTASEAALAGLMRDSGDGAGDDDADTGTKNITREHELSLAANAREMLEQTERALLRLDAGTYGICENCGKPIGKARMQAFPRATLCVECKQKQERRG